MTNDKIKAALDSMRDSADWVEEHYETIRQCLQSCLWNYNMDEAPRDTTRIIVMNGDEGGYHTEPFDIGVAEWSTCIGKPQWASIACCDGVSYYNPIAWRHIDPPEDLG